MPFSKTSRFRFVRRHSCDSSPKFEIPSCSMLVLWWFSEARDSKLLDTVLIKISYYSSLNFQFQFVRCHSYSGSLNFAIPSCSMSFLTKLFESYNGSLKFEFPICSMSFISRFSEVRVPNWFDVILMAVRDSKLFGNILVTVPDSKVFDIILMTVL